MRARAQELIDLVDDLDIEHQRKEAMIEKIKEWQSDAHAEGNTLAVTFENFWIELEPLFSELGWV